MINRVFIRSLIAIVPALILGCKPQPYGPVPSEAQLRWQEMEYNMFVHFGPNTFTGLKWGQGSETEDIFHPTALDCRQWAATAKAAGMKGIIITAKHHDGFCLWPNPESLHTVAQSSWRGGQGDVLKDLSEACREYGLKFGVYISPWDRNDPAYGSPAYNEKYIRTLQSVHDGRYGPVFEQWFDGACGEGPNGKRQEYDWPAFHEAVWALSPNAILFSDVGPGCRWMGNERGVAGETNWSRLDVAGFTPGAGAPPRDTLARGNVFGKQWIPGEIDVSIRPGWFWRESENAQVKSVEQLADIWLTSVGRNALLLLNVPPDTRGRIHEIDSTRLMEFRAWREKVLGVNLAADAGIRKRARGSIWEMTLPQARTVNYVQLQEEIALGQRISGFRVEAEDAGGWRTVAEGTTIGYKRILPVATVTAQKVRVTITASLARPVLKDIALY